MPDRLVGPVGAAAKLATHGPLPWALGRALGLYGPETRVRDVARYMVNFRRLHAPTVRWMVLAAARHDASDVLRAMPAPLLVIAGARDAFAPADTVGYPMHAAAPGSRLVVLADGTHGSPFGHADRIERLTEEFLDDVLGES
jgi:pimeloyl-ACP methyl ester carboxylesterase